MCSSAPKVRPVASAPDVGTTSIDDSAVDERNRERQRQRLRAGRQSTVLAGGQQQPQGATVPTAGSKTALGG